ncbi:MAG: hypothetical protein KF875_09235 [Trueperaceae bacterium]|nr:hypothetical protein [Trueperaceae bacterium]MCC6312096.1 hypothetical protein [Trueperaceae bacterium]MCO5174678.1 hypothetical protein [Trueperaceae bacterium]MCW5819423.1 hypothetical protein [Trueperaceae bacterium]
MEVDGVGVFEEPNRSDGGRALATEARPDLGSLSVEELAELCASLERRVVSGSAPLATYGDLASAQAELRRRGLAGVTEGAAGPT